MRVIPLKIHGCLKIDLDRKTDARGFFIKTFQDSIFRDAGFAITTAEDFYTCSVKGAIRGMHFQLPPVAPKKLVHCARGSILDVLLDLRVGSPTYLQVESLTIAGKDPCVLCLPSGIAHGFVALTDEALVCYKVNQEYDPALDAGIRWDSFGFDWPVTHPIVSDRDAAFPTLQNFITPFRFSGGQND